MNIRQIVQAASLACWVGVAFVARAQDADSSSFPTETQQAIEAVTAKELRAFGGRDPIPGAVIGVWVPHKGAFVKAIGFAHLSPNQPMALDDKFRVGSNTKTFVVTVLLQLVDEKRLSLDDPLSKFDIGVQVPNAEHITVRELCEMTSGLIDAYSTKQIDTATITIHSTITPRQLVAIAAHHPPLFPPGTSWNYSNTNYLILGLIIEAVTHHSAAGEIRDRILSRLKLTNTSFPTTDPSMPAPFSSGYGLDAARNWVDSTVSLPPDFTWTAGVMVSDMADMKRWVKDYVTGATNSAATQRQRLTCVATGSPVKFGLGVACTGGWYGYTGGIPGYNTAAYYEPAYDATIIAFVNSQREKPAPGVANSIVRDISRIVLPGNVAYGGK